MSVDPLTLNGLQLQMLGACVTGRRRVGVRAGWGSGKTTGLGIAAKFLALSRPGENVLWVTDTGPRLGAVVQPVCERLLGMDGWAWHGDQTQRYWEAPNGSRLWLRAYFRAKTRAQHQNPLEGINATAALIDEAQVFAGPEVLESVTGRVRTVGYDPIIMLAGLPIAGAWWLDSVGRAGGVQLRATSYVNRANLADGWFDDARATLTEDRYRAMVEDEPQAPTGQVYPMWSDAQWPDGNVLGGWVLDPSMRVRVCVDFGFRRPHVGFYAEDAARQVDVLFAEIYPDDCTVPALVAHALAVAWPRGGNPPDMRPRFRVDAGAGDPAGRSVNDQTGIDNLRLLMQAPPKGLGVPFVSQTDPVRRNVENGVYRVQSWMLAPDGRRRLVCTADVWEKGKGKPRSFRGMIEGLRWPDAGIGGGYVKDGERDHAADQVRYAAINWHWFDTAFDDRMAAQPRPTAPLKSRSLVTSGRGFRP